MESNQKRDKYLQNDSHEIAFIDSNQPVCFVIAFPSFKQIGTHHTRPASMMRGAGPCEDMNISSAVIHSWNLFKGIRFEPLNKVRIIE